MSPARPSVYDFIRKAGDGVPHSLHAADGVWHVTQVEHVLSVMPRLDARSRSALMDNARKIRDGLEAILKGVDDALAHYEEHVKP